MAQGKPAQVASSDDLADAFALLREHHGDIAGVKKDVASLDTKFGQLASKVDAVLEAVTKSTVRPSLTELMNGLLTLLLIVGGLAAGVGTYVSSTYSGPMSDLGIRLERAESALATRDAEDRAELVRLRQEDRLAMGERLKALESRWAVTSTPATP